MLHKTRKGIAPVGLGVVLALSIGGIGTASAQMEDEGHAYWTDDEGHVWKNEDGDCWYSPNEEERAPLEECGDMVQQEEPEPETTQSEPEMVERTERISMDARALFGFDAATLTADGKQKLDQLAQRVNNDWNVNSLRIIGHTDRIGPEDYNRKLSQDRAQAVADYLNSKSEFAQYDMRVMGLGESQPLVQCENTGGRDQLIQCLQPNRRVEVEVTGTKTVIEMKEPSGGDMQQ